MKRIFFASKINIDQVAYYDVIHDFQDACYGKWVEYENLHITYKFVGDIDEKYIPIMKGLLIDELRSYDCDIDLKGIGFFPRLSNAKVLYINMLDHSKVLMGINKAIENKLHQIGIPKDNKSFRPHLTLCRIKSSNIPRINEIHKEYKEKHFQNINSIDVNIYESKLTKHGPIYSII